MDMKNIFVQSGKGSIYVHIVQGNVAIQMYKKNIDEFIKTLKETQKL